MKFSQNQKNQLPELAGIYKFYSGDSILLYVGKAKNLKNRINSYFSGGTRDAKTRQLVSKIYSIEIIPVSSEFEALLLEAKLIKDAQPKYNVIWKDDKHYIYIKITKEKFPKVLFARKTEGNADFFGPFPSSTIVHEMLSYLRTIFPYCTQKETAKRACFYNHLGLCNPCPAEIVKTKGDKYKLLLAEYRNNINNIRQILKGRIKKIRTVLSSEMKSLSLKEDFEKAAIYRDKLSQLDYLANSYTPAESYAENPKLLNKIRKAEETELIKLLKPYYPEISIISHIECYDVSNISGKLATGSMVTFKNGEPDKNFYRKFRIRVKSTADDFAMLMEVLSRRLNHKEWKLPDLFITDGGKPQLIALGKVLETLRVKTPIIGLAKIYEEIVIPARNSYEKIKLPDNSPALNLIKRLRDEAHRFAHSYHTQLRLKHLLSTVENG